MGNFKTIQFHPDKLSDFVWRQGQKVLFSKAYRCACFDLDSYNKDIKCSLCDVDGFRYECDIPIRAIITGIQDQQGFNQVGELKQGDCIGGFPSQVPVAFHDKVALLNKWVREEALLQENTDDNPRLKDHKICKLEKARTIDRVFQPYIDFRLDVDGRTIIWMDNNNKPADGEKYTLQYYHLPIYMVWQTLPLERYSEDKRLPKHVILRRKDDFGNDLGRDERW